MGLWWCAGDRIGLAGDRSALTCESAGVVL